MKTFHIAAAIIRQDDNVVMVFQRAPDGNEWWSTPGGESIIDAAVREVREETGLEITTLGRLAYVTQWESIAEEYRAFAFVFEVKEWRGALKPVDPDGLVVEARFLSIDEVIASLKKLNWGILTEPAIAYLRGDAPIGTVWNYRIDADKKITLVARCP